MKSTDAAPSDSLGLSASQLNLRVRGLTKSFSGVPVLKGLDLDVDQGEVRGLLGANGSGKSTLVKCIAGVYKPDAGTIELTSHSSRNGLADRPERQPVRFVHQQLGLAYELSVWENVWMGSEYPGGTRAVCGWRTARDRARDVLHAFDCTVDPDEPVGHLALRDQVMVALARAGDFAADAHDLDGSVLILDEPTALLGHDDRHMVLNMARTHVTRGGSVVLISHRLSDIADYTDRVTVLRDGLIAGTVDSAGLNEEEAVAMMLGAKPQSSRQERPKGDPISSSAETGTWLVVEAISGAICRDISFSLPPGAIVGVTGKPGSGVEEIGRIIIGINRTAGRALVGGQPITDVHEAVESQGVAFIPRNRSTEGIFPGLSLRENLSLRNIRQVSTRRLVGLRAERDWASGLIDGYGIVPDNSEVLIENLSGGNQQKAVFASWLSTSPQLIVAESPVQGVDMRGRRDIAELLRHAAANDVAVLLIDDDEDFLCDLCQRVLVIDRGRVVDDLSGQEVDSHRLVSAMYS